MADDNEGRISLFAFNTEGLSLIKNCHLPILYKINDVGNAVTFTINNDCAFMHTPQLSAL